MICMSGAHCLARDEQGHPAETELPLCFHCLEAAERDVRALVLDYRDLEQHIPRGTSRPGDGMPHTRKIDAASPMDEDASDLQQEIWFVTDAWDAVARDVDRLAGKPQRVRAGWSVQQSVAILAPRLDRLAQTSATMWDYPGTSVPCPNWSARPVRNSATVLTIRCLQDGVRACRTCGGTGRVATATEVPGWQGVLDLSALHRRARGALGLSQPRRELCHGVPCRVCGLRALYRQDEGAVRCDGCALRYDPAEYTTWLGQLTGHGPESVIPAA